LTAVQVATNAARSLAIVTRVWRVLARPVLLRAVALGIAVGIPAFVISAGNGVRAVDVLAWLHRSLALRCLLWAGWLVLSAPAVRAVFVAPGSVFLRALRLPRGPLLFALFTLCAAVQLPWVVLFARGAGWVEAWSALTNSIALGCLAVSAGSRLRGLAPAAGVLGALLVACDPRPLVLAVLGTSLLPFALDAALRNALEQPALRLKFRRPSSALAALYMAHVLRLLRSERSRLSAALGAATAGSAGVVLSLHNDPSARPVYRALTVMALPLSVATAVCVAPLLENERRLRALLRSLRVRERIVVVAFLLAVGTPSSAFAATSGAVISANADLRGASLEGPLLGWAIALACSIALWGRFLEQRSRRGTGTFVAGVTLIAVLATVGASAW
jgi:hypothetical protein